ncbi:alanine racemase [Bryobacterales bacterium F-183]|nr:alanine racemase [Bryobacterales bacterium F-183]
MGQPSNTTTTIRSSPALHRSWVEVSLRQIADNFHEVRRVANPSVELMPVVKADAYRHGAVAVSRVLEEEGARWLAVSNADEGIALRESGCRTNILVMADFLPFERAALAEHHLTPVIHDIHDLADWASIAQRFGRTLPFHLKIDSGMGRLGTRADASAIADALQAAGPSIELEGLMTHFASAADFDSPQTDEQCAYFRKLAEDLAARGWKPKYLHMASTNPVGYAVRDTFCDLVRPGHAIYGYVSPARGTKAPSLELRVKPALTWKAAVLAVKDVEANARIGYGGMHVTRSASRIAILAAGYADGIPHRLGARGRVIVRGSYAPIIGAVSMDLTTIDITNCPPVGVGDSVILLGSEGEASIDAQQIARLAGTISYNVLCGIHARVKRVHL